MTKKDKVEAIDRIREALAACVPGGGSVLHISWRGGRPTDTGRSDYFDVEVWGPASEYRPYPHVTAWLNENVRVACGYRMTRDQWISVPGCGFNKAHHLAHEIARLTGLDLQVSGSWDGIAKKGG